MRSPTSSEHVCPTSGLLCGRLLVAPWENVEPRAGTAPPPCVVEACVEALHRSHRHRSHPGSPSSSLSTPCASPVVSCTFKARVHHVTLNFPHTAYDRMSNNKLLNLSLRIERRRVPLHTQHTCMHMQCRPSPPKQLRHSWLSRSQVSTAQQAQSAAINVSK